MLGTGGASQGEDDRALQALAGLLEIARVGGELPGDGGGQRAHPVLLQGLLGAQPVGRRRPPGGAVAIAGGEGRGGEGPCARSTAMLLAPERAIATASSSSAATSSEGAPRKWRAAPSVASATARHGESGSLSSCTACAPSASAALRSPSR